MRRATKPAIVFLVTHVSFFLSHHLPLARAMKKNGCKVVVAAHADADVSQLLSEGFVFREVSFRRQGVNLIHEFRTIVGVLRIYSRERPLLVHHFGHKAILYGALHQDLWG